MRKIGTVLTIAFLLISSVLTVQKAEATLGEADVYIIQLDGVPGYWVDDPSRVKDGAIEACMIQGLYMEKNVPRAHPKLNVDYPPYYDATPYVVTSWNVYENIITSISQPVDPIVVNTHGECLPVPSGYTKEEWVDEIADAMLNDRLTWVHVGGYPFFHVRYQDGGQEAWGDAGFKHFMNHIGKGDVDCWPPPPVPETERENATMQLGAQQQIGISWQFERAPGSISQLVDITYATLGRPLKIDDFKEHLIMPLFKWQGYWASAVIAFVNPGARYTGEYGAGAYVHIGSRHLYDGGGNPFDADHGRGFIGTAAALWIESMGFNPCYDASEKGYSEEYKERAFLKVYPSVSGVYGFGGTELYVRIEFAVCGILQGRYDVEFYVDRMDFDVWDLPDPWSNTEMMANLAFSREASGEALQLEGLYDESQELLGVVTDGLLWTLAMPLPGDPATRVTVSTILWGIGGLKLLGKWAAQGWSDEWSGVNEYADWIDFNYHPIPYGTQIDSKYYTEFSSIVTVDLKIPATDPNGSYRSGWRYLPIEYEITGYLHGGLYGDQIVESVDTLQLAVWFDGTSQDDAGSGSDAGDSYGTATQIDFPSNCHGYLFGSDNDDWYKFYVESGEEIYISMKPPPYVNFDLELYNKHNKLKAGSYRGAGVTDSIEYTTDSSGWWKVRIKRILGSGVYSLNLHPCGSGGGGCPFVYVWNGQRYVIDNNLLSASELSNGADVEDYCRLEQTLVRKDGKYSLLIGEFEHEHSYFDQVKLLAVDHDSDINIAVTPEGQFLTYKNPMSPTSCVDNNGTNRLNEIRYMDGNVSDPTTHFYGLAGDHLTLNFGHVNSEYAKLILRDDMKSDVVCIEVQVMNEDGEWQTVSVLSPRAYWSIEAVDLSSYVVDGQDFLVRLLWTSPHRLDYVGLDTTKQADYEMHEANLISAVHSTQDDVKELLTKSDSIYAELVPVEQIELEFTLPQNSKDTRTFILYAEGRYDPMP